MRQKHIDAVGLELVLFLTYHAVSSNGPLQIAFLQVELSQLYAILPHDQPRFFAEYHILHVVIV